MRLNVGGQTGGARDRLISQRFLPLRVPGCGSADESSTPPLPTPIGPRFRCRRRFGVYSCPTRLQPDAAPAGSSRNAIQLRGCDFDGGRPGIAGSSVFGAFDGPVAGAVAFDHAGVGAVSARPERMPEDFLDHAPKDVIVLVRGESPRSRRLRGG